MRRFGAGTLAYLGMAAALVVVPWLMTRQLPIGGSDPVASGPGGVAEPRMTTEILEVEGWGSEGFTGLVDELSSRSEAVGWEEVRRIMERRGCTELRYALRVRSLLSDGTLEDQTLIRRPYHEPQHFDEFLRYVRGGPDAAVLQGPGAADRRAAAGASTDPSPLESPSGAASP